MQTKKRKSPSLRFRGYTDDWEERKLGEVGKTKSGIGFSDAQQGGKQGTPFYKVSDMNNPGNEVVMMNANNYASDSQLKENKWNPINPQNSGVVFAKVGAAIFLDRKRIVDTSFLIDNNMMSYLFDSSWNRYFGKTLFEKLRLSRFAQVGALPSFNGSDVEDIKVMIPEESEQKMIGDMFEKLDDIIALHQRKLDLLKEQKKGFLQKMFPKNGSRVPELRFSGFADDWEERKFFESIASTIDFRGRTPKKLGMDWSDSGYLALSALNVKNGYIDPLADAHYGDEKLYRKWMSGRELKKGQVLFTTEAPMGNVAQVPDDNGYILSQRTVAFETKEDMMTNDFLAVLLKSPLVFNNLSALSSGGTAKGVSQKSLKGLSITVPLDIDEQQKIGSFFKHLDDTIALHQRKLDLLKEQKKGFLQKMFV
ncbi:restriction endonuclease subunit S [Leuconostoc mesenteroides]|uniref:restriction endonuclease subunit S n=1 Tax=Leuconostoc mesenteroides TaxID=1245 RepID=UPI001CBEB2C9|nr:restriction endonuclease subunit S [Leuconostoc mesenteroides]MBZ1523599.1 restriction endonuclease subunit S [Leuconostoc mesenteroides]